MDRTLLTLSKTCIALLLLGGFVVTFTQIAGILLGDADVVSFAGTTLFDIFCVVSGLAGIFAFLRLYTTAGSAHADSASIDRDES